MTKPIGVKPDDESQARLKASGKRCERSPQWLMKKAISEFVNREEASKQERKLLLGRWNRYQETEAAVPYKTVVKWLQTRKPHARQAKTDVAPGALDDLTPLQEFIRPNNPKAAANDANLLLAHPHLGRPIDDLLEFNELFIPFGQRGYMLCYRIDDEKSSFCTPGIVVKTDNSKTVKSPKEWTPC